MQEQGFTLNKFASGIRPYEKMPINSDTLSSCFNLIPRIGGLEESPDLESLNSEFFTIYPFPQVFFGHIHWILCNEFDIYTIDINGNLNRVLDLRSQYVAYPDTPHETWHFADFFDYIVITNGGVTVVHNPYTNTWEISDGINIPTLGSVLNFKGQIIGTGREIVYNRELTPDPKTVFNDTDSNSVLWGGIGSASFVVDQSNTKGYRPMPWTGEVYKLMQLGDFIVAYGVSGIAIMKFSGISLGIVKTFKFGIASRDAVNGDDTQHVFISTTGELYKLGEDLKLSDPIYKEIFSAMLGRTILINYNPLEGDFYITDKRRSFILSKQGLGEISYAVMSLVIISGVLKGFYKDMFAIDNIISYEVLFANVHISFGNVSWIFSEEPE